MKFTDIKPFTGYGSYSVDVGLLSIERTLKGFAETGLDLDPDFQRAHVWDDTKRIAFMEFFLRGGRSGKDILFNCPGWNRGTCGTTVLVDGKQRLEAARLFLNNKIKVFDHYFSEYEGGIRMGMGWFCFHINDLPTRAEVLQWYLEINSGGVVHTNEELDKVKKLLEAEKS